MVKIEEQVYRKVYTLGDPPWGRPGRSWTSGGRAWGWRWARVWAATARRARAPEGAPRAAGGRSARPGGRPPAPGCGGTVWGGTFRYYQGPFGSWTLFSRGNPFTVTKSNQHHCIEHAKRFTLSVYTSLTDYTFKMIDKLLYVSAVILYLN